MGTLVRAITAGFANGSRVRAGQEFELPNGVKPGKWLEVVKVDVPSKSKEEVEADLAAEAKAKAEAEAAAKAKQNNELRNLTPAAKAGAKANGGRAAADDLA